MRILQSIPTPVADALVSKGCRTDADLFSRPEALKEARARERRRRKRTHVREVQSCEVAYLAAVWLKPVSGFISARATCKPRDEARILAQDEPITLPYLINNVVLP